MAKQKKSKMALYTRQDKIILYCGYALLGLFLLAIIVPMIYIVIASFMDPVTLQNKGISFDFSKWSLDAYQRVVSDKQIWVGFKNAVLYSIIFTIVSVAVTMLAAYPMSLPDFKGKKLFNALFVITMFFSGGLIPTYLLINNLGLLDSMWAVILPGAFSVWNMIIARTYYQGIPRELREAADVDGASEMLLQKRFVILRLPRKDCVDDSAQAVTVTFLGRIDDALLPFPVGLVLDGGELMFQTNQVAQPLYCKGGKPEIFELPGSVQGSGIINNVVVDVRPVGVGGNDKSVLALQKTFGKLVADAVGFFRRNLTRLEGLPHLISDNIAFLPAPSHQLILAFGEHKFFVCGQWAALIAADQLSLVRFVRILRIVCAAFQAGRNRLALVFVQRDQTCCSQFYYLPAKRKCRISAASR